MGIKKIGDRVRIGSQVKLFRSRECRKGSKRSTNRVRISPWEESQRTFLLTDRQEYLALLDNPTFTPPSSGSPRPLHLMRGMPTSRSEKRMSRQIAGPDLNFPSSIPFAVAKSPSRPGSPLVDQDGKSHRPQRLGATQSPKEIMKRDPTASYYSSGSSRLPGSSIDTPQTARFGSQSRAGGSAAETPQTARFAHHARGAPSVDISVTNSAILPPDKALIRVIFDNGRSSVVSIDGCKTAEDVILKTLRKGLLNEGHVKNYCFYVLDGIEPNPSLCRRLHDADLLRICSDGRGMERGRLILRKIHSGEPEDEQLRAAAGIAAQQLQQSQGIIVPTNNRSQAKVEKIMGESLAAVSYPLSPTSQMERDRHISSAAQDLERDDGAPMTTTTPAHRVRKLKEFYGTRPPSELIASDLGAYFPDGGAGGDREDGADVGPTLPPYQQGDVSTQHRQQLQLRIQSQGRATLAHDCRFLARRVRSNLEVCDPCR